MKIIKIDNITKKNIAFKSFINKVYGYEWNVADGYIAWSGKHPIGILAFTKLINSSDIKMELIAVDAEFQNRKVATKMLTKLKDDFKNVHIYAHPYQCYNQALDNDKLLHLFKQNGINIW